MALGGGSFTTQNKPLPGAYINFVSAARDYTELSDRGVAALPLAFHWGPPGKVLTVTAEEFQKNAQTWFGYEYTAPQLTVLREVYLGAKTVHWFRLDHGGESAANAYAKAKYSGTRGNDLKIVVTKTAEDVYLVETLLDNAVVDAQTVSAVLELQDNAFVTWESMESLEETAGAPLAGGSDGEITGEAYQGFLNAIEGYSFNAVGCLSEEPQVSQLFVAWTKRLRDEMGVKFQTVLANTPANHEGIVSVCTGLNGNPTGLIPWVTGIIAGCAVSKSNTNRVYDGEYVPDIQLTLTQTQLAEAKASGQFVLHRTGDTVRVLEDINSLTTYTAEKSADFSSNQVLRVLDQIAMDIQTLFVNRYLGEVPNDPAGRASLWSDVVSHHRQMETIRAIHEFEPKDVTVEEGETRKSVVIADKVKPSSAMTHLYMVVTVE